MSRDTSPAGPAAAPDASTTSAPQAATVLPLARSAGTRPSTLIVVSDDDQQFDHNHRPVPPIAVGGIPYRYQVRLDGAKAYASTADEVLALFIDDYLPQPPVDRDTELAQIRRRGEHCLGVIVTHVAHAMLDGRLTAEETAVLQRSAEFGAGRDPITRDECPRWDHPEVALVLMGDLYAPEYGRFEPPTGNVVLVWPGRAERYLTGLAGLGLVALAENPAVTSAPLVEVRGLDADATTAVDRDAATNNADDDHADHDNAHDDLHLGTDSSISSDPDTDGRAVVDDPREG